MDTWTFIWLMFILKIPIIGLFLLVRWAIKQTPEEALGEEDGGIGFQTGPRTPGPPHPHHPRPRLPRGQRRGPHRDAPRIASPPRVRAVVAQRRLTQR